MASNGIARFDSYISVCSEYGSLVYSRLGVMGGDFGELQCLLNSLI